MPPQHLLDRLNTSPSEQSRIKLFDSTRLHGLDASARDYRTKHDFFIDLFFRHRWYNGNHNREGMALVQAWNAFVHNCEVDGRETWMTKLTAQRSRFERRSPVGARHGCIDFKRGWITVPLLG